MRPIVLLVFISFLSFSIHAQVDSRPKSVIIPAIENENDSTDASPLTPSQPIENSSFGMNTPKVSPNLEMPKKQFSMFPEEEFGNPGEIYNKKLKTLRDEVLPEGHGEFAGLKEDAYWGDYRTKSEYIDIYYRDYGQVDGDYLSIRVNDDVIKSSAYLNQNFSGFRLQLLEGFNKIEFVALNEGALLPNTAAYKIVDQWKETITGKIWALSTGVKVTIIIIKE